MTPDEVRAVVREEIAAHEAGRVTVDVLASFRANLERLAAELDELRRRASQPIRLTLPSLEDLTLQVPNQHFKLRDGSDHLSADVRQGGLDVGSRKAGQALTQGRRDRQSDPRGDLHVGQEAEVRVIHPPTLADRDATRQANDPTP